MLVGIIALPFALVWSLLVSLMRGMEFGQVLSVGRWGGIGFGLSFGFVTAFLMKAVTISMTFQDKKAFLSRLNVALAEIGYHPKSQTESFLTYKPSLQAGLLTGKISIQIEDTSATIVGPNTYIKNCKNSLRDLSSLRILSLKTSWKIL